MTTVKRTLDRANPPKLTEEAKARYDAMPDDQIDYSDSPDMGDVDWSELKIEDAAPKPTVTMRLDADVIGYFKDTDPKGFTSRMAAVLKAYVASQRKRQAHIPSQNHD